MLIEKGRWSLNDVTPLDILKSIPDMGKLMVIFRTNGITHERIGEVETVTLEDEVVILGGATHDARLDPASLSAVLLDTSSEMQGTIYPRIEFTDEAGVTIVALVGMEGPEPFINATSDCQRSELPLRQRERPSAAPNQPTPDQDPGHTFLSGMVGETVKIKASQPGFSQSWVGVIENVKPSMGFSNIMTSDFHLHLRAGAVADWKTQGPVAHALDADGKLIGLSVHRVAVTR